MYQYLFYILYVSLEKYSSPRFWSEWKAASLLVIFLFSIIYSLILYYTILINRYSTLGNNLYFLFSIVVIISVINYFLFIRDNKWKNIIEKFERLPKNKNKIGTIICNLFFIVSIINLIYAFYLFSQVNWTLYK